MKKYRYTLWSEDGLRLQEVVPDGKVRARQASTPWSPHSSESSEEEEDSVVALTWPEESGWRSH